VARLAALLGSLLGGLLGDRRRSARPTCRKTPAEGLLHVYNGGGVTASGPAFLVRKSVADRFSLTGSYYLDAGQQRLDRRRHDRRASTRRRATSSASPGDYVYRDSQITLGGSTSHEPDYTANRLQPRHLAGGVRRHDDGGARLHPRRRQGRARRTRPSSPTSAGTGSTGSA
jgi:hypothetical protein